MDTTALQRIRANFLKSRAATFGSALGSIGAAVCYVALLILLYLFVDLLVWKGEMPSFRQMTAAQQREFADEWAKRPLDDRVDAAKRIGLPEAAAQARRFRRDRADARRVGTALAGQHLPDAQ